MAHLRHLTVVAISLAVGCGPLDGSGPATGEGKGDGVGTTHTLVEQVTQSFTVGVPAYPEETTFAGATTVASHDGTQVTVQGAEYFFTHNVLANSKPVEIAFVDRDRNLSFVVDYRLQGELTWQRLRVGPGSPTVGGGSLPEQDTELFHKVLLVPMGGVAGEIWASWTVPGVSLTASAGLPHVTPRDDTMGGHIPPPTEYRIFVTQDWDFQRWDDGESRAYNLTFRETIAQRYLW